MHAHRCAPARGHGPAVDSGQLAARTYSGLVDFGASWTPYYCYSGVLLSTFNVLQATGTPHLCPVLCDVPVLVLVFELFVFLFDIFSMGSQERV